MAKNLLVLILVLQAAIGAARSPVSVSARREAPQLCSPEPAAIRSTLNDSAMRGRISVRPLNAQAFTSLKSRHPRSRYDIKRDRGAYTFDTLYKLWRPGAKHISIDLHGGYTYYDKYSSGSLRHGVSGYTPGLIGGLSIMKICSGGDGRGAFLRLNADAISYANRRYEEAARSGTMPSLSSLSRELSARIYLDGKITTRYRGGALTTHYLIGVSNEAHAAGTAPFFVGLGLGYRFL